MLTRLSKVIIVVGVAVAAVGGFVYLLPGTGTEEQPPVVRPPEPPISALETEGSAFMDEEGVEINPFCDRTCGGWIVGSCVRGNQYLERSCTCAGSDRLFYETRLEPSTCEGA